METVCGNVVKRIELEKRMNLLKVGSSHQTHKPFLLTDNRIKHTHIETLNLYTAF